MKSLPVNILLFSLLLSLNTNAQSWKLMRYEFVGGVGTANIFGDLTGASNTGNENLYGIKDFVISDTRPSLLLAARYKVTQRFSARMNFIYSPSKSNGSFTKLDGESKVQRDGVVVNTQLLEITPQMEFYFLREERKAKSAAIFNRRGMVNSFATLSAYFFAGAGAVHAKPTITVNNPNSTFLIDRKDEIYQDGLWTLVLPAGVGVKYVLNGRYVLGFEFGGRYTFSDNIDGFSPTVGLNPKQYPKGKTANDIYYFTSINLSYKLRTSRDGIPEFLENFSISKGFSGLSFNSNKARTKKSATRSRRAPVRSSNPRRR